MSSSIEAGNTHCPAGGEGTRRCAERVLATGALVGALVMTSNVAAPVRAATFAPGSSGTGDPYFPLQGNGGYDVRHYDITFFHDPAARRMAGSTRIAATATQDLSRFNLDFTGLAVGEVVVNGSAATFSQEGQELVVTPRTAPARPKGQ